MIEIVDERGRIMRYQMSDEDSDIDYTAEEIAAIGVYTGVPDLDQVDWDETVTKLHNTLYKLGLFTMDDLLAREGILSTAITASLKSSIVKLYSEGDK